MTSQLPGAPTPTTADGNHGVGPLPALARPWEGHARDHYWPANRVSTHCVAGGVWGSVVTALGPVLRGLRSWLGPGTWGEVGNQAGLGWERPEQQDSVTDRGG